MLCITVAFADKFTNVLEGNVIGTSKHVDYALFHFKARDVAALKKPITKFVFVSAEGAVTEIILAEAVKDRGQNFKTAKRDTTKLTEAEQAEVTVAVELARAAINEQPKPKADQAAPIAEAKAVITDAAAANGLQDLHARGEGTQRAEQAATEEGGDAGAQSEGDGSEGEAGTAPMPEAAPNPSRQAKASKKKRR